MKTYNNPKKELWAEIIKRPTASYEDLYPLISEIFNKVKHRGDEALLNYTQSFDKVKLDTLIISKEEVDEAKDLVDPTLKQAIQKAKQNIESFHWM